MIYLCIVAKHDGSIGSHGILRFIPTHKKEKIHNLFDVKLRLPVCVIFLLQPEFYPVAIQSPQDAFHGVPSRHN